jgi:hypothetical protein
VHIFAIQNMTLGILEEVTLIFLGPKKLIQLMKFKYEARRYKKCIKKCLVNHAILISHIIKHIYPRVE